MTIEEAKELEVGTFLECNWSVVEILKVISDGYIVLYYDCTQHHYYHVRYLSYEDIVEYYNVADLNEYSWIESQFDGKNIKADGATFDETYFYEVEQ